MSRAFQGGGFQVDAFQVVTPVTVTAVATALFLAAPPAATAEPTTRVAIPGTRARDGAVLVGRMPITVYAMPAQTRRSNYWLPEATPIGAWGPRAPLAPGVWAPRSSVPSDWAPKQPAGGVWVPRSAPESQWQTQGTPVGVWMQRPPADRQWTPTVTPGGVWAPAASVESQWDAPPDPNSPLWAPKTP